MVSLWTILMALFGSMLNARVTNGRPGQWEDLENRASEVMRINGPLGRISGRGNANNLSSDLMQVNTTTPEEEEQQGEMDSGECKLSETVGRINALERSTVHVKCTEVVNLTISLEQIPQSLMTKITSISVTKSIVNTVNLTQFHKFPALRNLSVTKSNVSFVVGSVPFSLRSLNLSHNNIRSVDTSWFSHTRDATKLYKLQKSTPTQPLQSNLDPEQSHVTATSDYLSPKPRTKFPHNNNYNSNNNKGRKSWTRLPKDIATLSSGESGVDHLDDDWDAPFDAGGGSSPIPIRDTNYFETTSRLQVIDVSHNKITQLPKSIFYLRRLESLHLSGNHLKCEFVWERLWKWTEMRIRSKSVLSDAETTFCGVDDARVFQYSIQGVLQARKAFEKTCATVNKSMCSSCSLYALQKKEGHHHTSDDSKGIEKNSHDVGKTWSSQQENSAGISISLKLDCSSKNLTEVPPVPPQTWQLNISNNRIKDLSPLKLAMYSNLLILDGASNQVNLETLAGTPFIDKYNYLNLKNNGFSTIPTYILTSLNTIRGQGVTFFGGNYIECDCNSVKEIKPLLIENSKRIRDMKDIFCKDINVSDGSRNTRVKDLQYSDVCHMDSSDSEFTSELYLYVIIFVEAVLIILIIAKVWIDGKSYRQTGILPWCSAKMPRLPCDAMLESVKEPPNLGRQGGGSATSSNANVINTAGSSQHSAPGIQLKDFRSSRGRSDDGGAASVCSNRSSRNSIQQPHSSSRNFSV
ncbi:uncharacterized protein LOC118438201 [Folsomia candida]|uniref:Protein halfway n=1 Tax=Folsomia candida TaxID=158441 RepID=A0A226F4M9_FOLCA|nr:uncharacterized protein LOC118438201 [Folsomia candida]OXA64407.1 Protein halfway [Folsomia candida]